MIPIDRVYRTVTTLANTDVRGNAKPDEIRMLINNSVNEIIDSYFFEVNRATWRQNVGRVNNGLENIPDRIREKINHFSKSEKSIKQSGQFKMPADLLFIDTIETLNNIELEPCKHKSEFNAISRVNASVEYPIYYKAGDYIETAPDSLGTLTFHYLRKHKIAKWTFVIDANGNEMFNPSASDFQDIDLHPSEEANVILKTLEKLGINLKEQDLTITSMNKESQEFSMKNS